MPNMPDRETSPTVGLIPTMPEDEAGRVIDPSVSVPMAAKHMFAVMATADPELEPSGLRSRMYALRTCPATLLHPLTARVDLI
mmetsp:Transcript_13006/g.27974  ORF Transcript_13006/g.27974 Transcript_13006/m.27974 type:complete len:83 (-) Transcript_13006:4805-5053(-)